MSDPKPTIVQVVITTRNRTRYLKKAINSVLEQDFTGVIRLLVQDDGSTEDVRPILDEVFKEVNENSDYAGERYFSYYMDRHLGRGFALWSAIERSMGVAENGQQPLYIMWGSEQEADYLMWIDDDDWLAPHAVKQLVYALRRLEPDDGKPHTEVVYANCWQTNEVGQVTGLDSRAQGTVANLPDALLTDFLTFHPRLMTLDVYKRVGGIDPSYTYAQDYDICLRLSEITRFAKIEIALYYWRKHDGNISCAHKAEQADFCARAANAALRRRGKDSQLVVKAKLQVTQTLELQPAKNKAKLFGIGMRLSGDWQLYQALQHFNTSKILYAPDNLMEVDYCGGAVGGHVAYMYKELFERYPGSKFIYTGRDIKTWMNDWEKHDEVRELLVKGQYSDAQKEQVHLERLGMYGRIGFDCTDWVDTYKSHSYEVKEFFESKAAQDRIIYLDIEKGADQDLWTQLTSFLGVNQVLLSMPFPRAPLYDADNPPSNYQELERKHMF